VLHIRRQDTEDENIPSSFDGFGWVL